jgi:hypothetical protein
MVEKWEYKTYVTKDYRYPKEVTAELNYLGEYGWEAVGIHMQPMSYNYIILFKRKIVQ